MKSPEMKRMHGIREMDNDGFTYPYGKQKFNYNTRSTSIRIQIRNDKRSVRQAEDRRITKEGMNK